MGRPAEFLLLTPLLLVPSCQLLSGVTQLEVEARELGQRCRGSWDCLSGHCADDVCCETACDGPCEACNATDEQGICTPHAARIDPDGDCLGLGTCDGSGTCTSTEPLWSYRYGGEVAEGLAGMAVDGAGNVILGGTFDGTISFGGDPLVSAGQWDVFVAKLNDRGQHLWSKRIGDGGRDIAHGVAVAPDGSVIVVGTFTNTFDIGAGNLRNAAGVAQYVAKFASDGRAIWLVSFNDTGEGPPERVALPLQVATDAAGDVYVAGRTDGRIVVPAPDLLLEAQDDVFVTKLEAAGGDERWTESFAAGGNDHRVDFPLTPIIVNTSGDVFVAGTFKTSLQFGSQLLTSTGPEAINAEDIFCARLAANGQVLGARQYGDEEVQGLEDLAAAPNGDVVLTGPFRGELDFGDGTLASEGAHNIYLAKVTDAFVVDWSDSFFGSFFQVATTVSVDTVGNVILAGGFQGSGLDLGGGPLANFSDAPSEEESDIFLGKFQPTGDHLLSKRYGQAGGQVVYYSATDAGQNVHVAGHFTGSVDFGRGTLTAVGDTDMFVAKFAP